MRKELAMEGTKELISQQKEVGLMKQLFALSWPAMLEYLLQMVVQYADLLMVGMIGVNATAIVGFASQVNFMIKFPINGLGIGVTAYLAKALGESDAKKIHKGTVQAGVFAVIVAIASTIYIAVLAPLLPTLLDIDLGLRSDFLQYFCIAYSTMAFFSCVSIIGAMFNGMGQMKIAMYINVMINICNVVCNFVLIYPTRMVRIFGYELKLWGAGLGLNGAAVGTALATAAGGISILVVYARKTDCKLFFKIEWVDLAILKQFMKVGVPSALGSLFTGMGRIVFTSFVSSLGVVAVAAHSISYSLEGMFYIPAIGFQRAVITLSGVSLGEQNEKKYISLVRKTAAISMGILLLMGGLLFGLADSMTPWMTDSTETAELSASMLKLVAFSEPLFALRLIMEGAFEGIGKTKFVFVADISSMWLFRVALCGLLVKWLFMGLTAVWCCMIADNVFLALSLTIVFLMEKWRTAFHR